MTAQDARSAEIVFPRAVAAGARVGIAVRHVKQTGSTNTDLASEARAGDFASCALVADLQTAGRGRRDRAWEAAAAQHLLTSFRLPISAAQAPPMVVSVAAAVRQAVASLTPVAVGFKWPNDLLIEEGPRPGKLAGVLAEYVSGTPGAIIVGVGVNIGQTDRDGATSLTAVGGTADRDHILSLVLESLASMRENPTLALAELRVHSLTLGRSVRVELPGSTSVEGVAVDLGPAGELIVDVDGERRSFSAGDVVHLRSA
ncbi:MAG: biotin--[acetyl-CoA-carboxylase] ligase [Acidimicrobiales bacterium]|nr:biotin--[acetyl-CoA-carboxylase] ligase [Acidimicrobiales bacterium]MDG2218662.1 biotin--[acetyl-CoA-carboxylase] ligase [Acidimicrobiales bacterium]